MSAFIDYLEYLRLGWEDINIKENHTGEEFYLYMMVADNELIFRTSDDIPKDFLMVVQVVPYGEEDYEFKKVDNFPLLSIDLSSIRVSIFSDGIVVRIHNPENKDSEWDIIYSVSDLYRELPSWVLDYGYTNDLSNLDASMFIPYKGRKYPYSYDSIDQYSIFRWEDGCVVILPEPSGEDRNMLNHIFKGINKSIANEFSHLDDLSTVDCEYTTLIISDNRIVGIAYQGDVEIVENDMFFPQIKIEDAKKAIEYCEKYHLHSDKDEAISEMMIEFIELRGHFEQLKDGIIPYAHLHRGNPIAVQATYHAKILDMGYPFFLTQTDLDNEVRKMADNMDIKYREVNYPISLGFHDNLLHLRSSVDVPISIIKHAEYVSDMEEVCCSQSHCEHYDIEVKALIRM